MKEHNSSESVRTNLFPPTGVDCLYPQIKSTEKYKESYFGTNLTLQIVGESLRYGTEKKKNRSDCKPGSVTAMNAAPAIYPHAVSPQRCIVLPSGVCACNRARQLGRAALVTPVYMNFQHPMCTARMSPCGW